MRLGVLWTRLREIDRGEIRPCQAVDNIRFPGPRPAWQSAERLASFAAGEYRGTTRDPSPIVSRLAL